MLKRAIRDEEGKALIIVLILLVVGGLVLLPLLGLMNTGLASGHLYDSKMLEYYAADAGVEEGIWHLQQGGDPDDVLDLNLNGRNITVQMEELPHECFEPPIYEIISTATSDDGPGTTITTHVTGIGYYVNYDGDEVGFGENITYNIKVAGDLTLHANSTVSGNVIADGSISMDACTMIGGAVSVGGDLALSHNASVVGTVIVTGDLTLHDGASINGTVCVKEGYLTVDTRSSVQGDVYVARYVKVIGGADGPSSIVGNVYAGEYVVVDGASWIEGNVWADGQAVYEHAGETVYVSNWKASIDGDVYVHPDAVVQDQAYMGTVHYDLDDEWDAWVCGLEAIGADLEILSWEIT
jgi:cytoskeletal protein CcmA (bactofilin family)